MLDEPDNAADELNISRQAVIKTLVREVWIGVSHAGSLQSSSLRGLFNLDERLQSSHFAKCATQDSPEYSRP
jgi:hypothetical protein